MTPLTPEQVNEFNGRRLEALVGALVASKVIGYGEIASATEAVAGNGRDPVITKALLGLAEHYKAEQARIEARLQGAGRN